MNRLLITRPLPAPVVTAAEAICDVDVRQQTSPLSASEKRAALSDYDVVLPTLGDTFDRPLLTGQHRCRLLANFGVGFNHIDATAAREHGVEVTNTPGAVTDATADIALTLMLMTCRRAGEGERLVRAGKWEGWHPTQLLGTHMSGKTLGIIGMGRIGKAIARRAQGGFGMQVVYFNRSPVSDPGVEATQLSGIEDVLRAADVVVIAVPATPQTHHLIGAREFAEMKSTAHLINIARGDIVDEGALINALRDGRIAGAGLDVYEFEPRVPQALIDMENVTLLPHMGTSAEEVRINMGLMAVENVRAFLAGEVPPNRV